MILNKISWSSPKILLLFISETNRIIIYTPIWPRLRLNGIYMILVYSVSLITDFRVALNFKKNYML